MVVNTKLLPTTNNNGTSKRLPPKALPSSGEPSTQEAFPYGWRIVATTEPDGSETIKYIPLQPENFLDPQLGDVMVQSEQHFRLVKSLFDRFDIRYLNDPTTGVMSDVKMLWGIPGLQEPAPDLAVIPHLMTKGQEHSSFDTVTEGTRPCLVVEVISPRYAGDDTTKVSIYARAGVQEYVIINPHFDDWDKPYELTGYRLAQGQYVPIQPDDAGRLYSMTTTVWFGLDESERNLVLEDGDSNELLLDNRAAHAARLQAEQRATAAEAEVARLRAQLAQRDNRED